ncbi:hypothetical protein [Actinomadura gamaensis]|uniref:Transcriptional regulator n=1 Tax=Actinomadura gamaensis TaxID=1763541 RepID=A0ABV9UAP3_9ACTN
MAMELRDAAEHPHKMPSIASLQRNIERWESGDVQRISERYRILYGRALNMPEDELFDTSPVDPPPPDAYESDIEAIRAMLTALMTSDRQFGGRQLRRQATDYLSTVIEPRLHANSPAALRRRMFEISTEFTMRVAAMHLDSDQADQALALLGRAASMANESQDMSLTAWVLARRGEHELHQASLATRPAQRSVYIDQALAYTEGAVGVARAAPPMARAFLTTKSALAWSMTGQRAKTEQHLGAVWTSFDAHGTATEPPWVGSYGWGHLQHEAARCYANLGMGPQAVRAATQALTVRTAGRPRAFSLGILAIAHAQALEIEEACRVGHQFVDLAAQIASRRIVVRVGEVLQALKPYQDRPEVVELREAVEPLLAGSND